MFVNHYGSRGKKSKKAYFSMKVIRSLSFICKGSISLLHVQNMESQSLKSIVLTKG